MSKPVRIIRDDRQEMLEVYIDGELYITGNFWDVSASTWINIMKSAGIAVEDLTIEDEEGGL